MKPQPQQKTAPTRKQVETATKIIAVAETPYATPTQPSTAPAIGTPTGPTIIPMPLSPIVTEASIDPRYASDFQPDYPPGERRAGREGKVVIRVLIGVDGRVKRTELVSAASDAFWRATSQRALTKWRFRPATRGGAAIEVWRTMTVRFEME